MSQHPLAGQQVRIIDVGDNGEFFKEGDIATIAYADEDGDLWAEFPDGEEWCIGTGSKNIRCQSDKYTKWELIPAKPPQNLQSQVGLSDATLQWMLELVTLLAELRAVEAKLVALNGVESYE